MKPQSLSIAPTTTTRNRWGPIMIAGMKVMTACVYCALLMSNVPLFASGKLQDLLMWPKQHVITPVERCLTWMVGPLQEMFGRGSVFVVHGVYLLITGMVLPWLLMALLRRGTPRDIGLRLPNRLGWRVWLIACALALPSLFWLSRGGRLTSQYLGELERIGASVFLSYYLVNMLSEHVLIHGVLLGFCRPGTRWPARTGAGAAVGRNPLRWLGLAQPTGNTIGWPRLRTWLGLPEGCVLGMLTSTAVFALVHVGKDPRELILSIPGGLSLAFLAYRTNSAFVPLLIHLTTAGITFLLIPR